MTVSGWSWPFGGIRNGAAALDGQQREEADHAACGRPPDNARCDPDWLPEQAAAVGEAVNASRTRGRLRNAYPADGAGHASLSPT